MFKSFLILALMTAISSCSTLTNQEERLPAADESERVEVFLVHSYADFRESNDDEDLHRTSLGLLSRAEEASQGDIDLKIKIGDDLTELTLKGLSARGRLRDTIKLFEEQLQSGQIEAIAKGRILRGKLVLDSEISTTAPKVSALIEALKFEKTFELEESNTSMTYQHDFSFQEGANDKDLYRTDLGKVYKIVLEEIGPEYPFNRLAVYSKIEEEVLEPKTILFGRVETSRMKTTIKTIKSECSRYFDFQESYEVAEEILNNSKNNQVAKAFNCVSEGYDRVYVLTDNSDLRAAIEKGKDEARAASDNKKPVLFDAGD